jgi:hypothetical protein
MFTIDFKMKVKPFIPKESQGEGAGQAGNRDVSQCFFKVVKTMKNKNCKKATTFTNFMTYSLESFFVFSAKSF